MGNRTFICKQCGFLKRGRDNDRYGDHPIYTHCGESLSPLSHEQSVASRLIEPNERIIWYKKGAYILRGNKKKKRWIPVIKKDDIKLAIKQEKNYVKIDQAYFENQAKGIFEKLVEKYIDKYFSFINELPHNFEDLDLTAKLIIVGKHSSERNNLQEKGKVIELDLQKILMNQLRLGYLELFEDQNFVNYLYEEIEKEDRPQVKREKMKIVLALMASYGYPHIKDDLRFLQYWSQFIYNERFEDVLLFCDLPKAQYLNSQIFWWENDISDKDWDYSNSVDNCDGDINKIKNPCEFIHFLKNLNNL